MSGRSQQSRDNVARETISRNEFSEKHLSNEISLLNDNPEVIHSHLNQESVWKEFTKDSIYNEVEKEREEREFRNNERTEENNVEVLSPVASTSQSTQVSFDGYNNSKAAAFVNFYIYEDSPPLEREIPLNMKVVEMRYLLAEILQETEENIKIFFNGIQLPDDSTLNLLGIEEDLTVSLEVVIASQKEVSTPPVSEFEGKEISNLLESDFHRQTSEEFEHKQLIQQPIIERSYTKKPFLGGYRHKITGMEYHNAATQTLPPPRDTSLILTNSISTQTIRWTHGVCQTRMTSSTQMTRPGVFISNLYDKILIPTVYETADEYIARKSQKIVIIQKYCRRWLAQKLVDQLRLIREARLEWEKDEQTRKLLEKQQSIREELQRRTNPKTKHDFDLLYNALEKWRLEELERINATLYGSERKAALYMLLAQETELIHAISRHQVNVAEENKEAMIQQLLKKAAAPKVCNDAKGDGITMDTPYTIRGRELLEIYNSLNMKYLTQDERLDVLLTVKHTVKDHNCKLTVEIIELIDREVDLVMRGVHEKNLLGLRKRISSLFLQYCKTPTFNPEISRHLRVPQDESQLHQNVHYCRSCGRYLKGTDFIVSSTSTGLGVCKQCRRHDNIARQRQELSVFQDMLLNLRKQEKLYEDDTKIVFLLEEADIRYLVENIWESMSVISGWRVLKDLVLCRWQVNMEWSPWNCILLTKDEARAHRKLANPSEAYAEMLIQRVRQKHILASHFFSQLKSVHSTTNRFSSSTSKLSSDLFSGTIHSSSGKGNQSHAGKN